MILLMILFLNDMRKLLFRHFILTLFRDFKISANLSIMSYFFKVLSFNHNLYLLFNEIIIGNSLLFN